MKISKLFYYMFLARNLQIIRRYLITNSFDASMTILGLIIANFFLGIEDPVTILAIGLGGGIAMCISGISSVYLIESAEKMEEFKAFELSMGKKLDESHVGEAAKLIPLITALVGGLSPFITVIIILLPFIFSTFINLSFIYLYYLSFIIALMILFILGLYMGKIAGQNIWRSGIKSLAIGLITFVVIFLIKGIFLA